MAKAKPFLDELLSFLGDVVFQIPVRNFMDENCLTFDPAITPMKEHHDIHHQYKKLVDVLLDSFCSDVGAKYDDVIKGIKAMNKIPDLKEVFQVIFEQVLAADNFDVFFAVMARRNLIIQEQALVILIAATGMTPSAFIPEGHEEKLQAQAEELKRDKNSAAKPPSPRAGLASNGNQMKNTEQEDDEILHKVIAESKKQFEKEKKLSTEDQATIKQAELESSRIAAERLKLDQAMSRISLSDKLPPPAAISQTTSMKSPSLSASSSKQAAGEPAAQPPVETLSQDAVSKAQSANRWLQSPPAEGSTTAAAHAVYVQEMAKMTPDELKRRQDFLKQQRDKLLAMKKSEREKALNIAEQSNGRNRPQSARVAKASMSTQAGPSAAVAHDPEEEKKLALRRAIADKLRAQVVGK